MLSDWLTPISSDAGLKTPRQVLLVTPKFRYGDIDAVANIEQFGASIQLIPRERDLQPGQTQG
ncbi:hypothetical protein MesoLjLa_63580 (plasmid) [Mesorhizobium sp. L-2-11]|nr:hypothetical protein MesoLjLa_63580 [Mesorhizobium sp. L-2-11]